MLRSLGLSLVLVGVAFAQADFEPPQPACAAGSIPVPCGAIGNPEGISWNGVLPVAAPPGIAFGASAVAANGPVVPCLGVQFLRVQSARTAGVTAPLGGPIPEASTVARLYIPVPPGAMTVSFCWDFFCAEGPQPIAGGFNDAIQIDAVPGCAGPPILTYVYADTASALVVTADPPYACACIPYGPAGPLNETGPLGANAVIGAPVPPGAAFLRVSASNGFDNSFPSQCLMDAVAFGYGPPIPCTLDFGIPLGVGSISIHNTPCPGVGGASYFIGINTGPPGAFPGGWFFGIDITWAQLVSEINFAIPGVFSGTLDNWGSSAFVLPAGIPPGIPITAVTVHFTPGFGVATGSRPPVAYITGTP